MAENSWTNLIKYTKDGLYVANFVEVKNMLVERFKAIYGEDIDLDNGSADGIYVNNLALMLNNILQSYKNFYSQLDITTASGKYLDNLCALSNVYRKSATYSTASITVQLADSENDYTISKLQVVDDTGLIWTWSSTDSITLTSNSATQLVVKCEKIGPIKASAGSITKAVNNDVIMTIKQDEDAIIGSYEETDNELRSRRNASLSSTGTTVLESLKGSLLTLSGIDDVYIYNNDTTESKTALDNTNINAHSIYIISKQKQNITIDDKTIGNLIYYGLTPGISTTQTNDTTAGESYSYSIYPLQGVSSTVQTVYWKKAKPVSPQIKIVLTPTSNYSTTTSQNIIDNIVNDLNDRQINSIVNYNELWSLIVYSDSKYRGQSTFNLKSITMTGMTDNEYQLKDTYFYYSTSNIESNGDITITIGE